MSEKENINRTPKLSNIHWGRKSPISQPETNEAKILCNDELDRFARGVKTLRVIKIDPNVQNKKRNVIMRPFKSKE